MTKSVWFHVSALSAWNIKKAHKVSCQELSLDYKYLHASQIPHNKDFLPNHSCLRYFIGVFCYNFKSQTKIIASY